jgi:hypothetical protein
VTFIESQDNVPHPLHPNLTLGNDEESESDEDDVNHEMVPPDAVDANDIRTTAEGGVPNDEGDANAPDYQHPDAPVLDGPPLRRSARIPKPSAAGAAMRNLPYTSRTEKAVAEITSASTLARLVRSAKKDAEFEANFIEDMALAGIVHEEEDPCSFTEALKGPNGPIWQLGMDSEVQSMAKHHIWDLVPRSSVPVGKKVIKSKTVCHIKHDESGKMAKLKVCIVAKGFTQIAGQDYHDTFSPVARLESFHVVLTLAATLNWEIRQLDMKTAFLHSDLEEEIYMEQAEGSIVKGKEDHVCRL